MLWTILIGLIVGIVAKMIMPGKDPGGFIVTTIIGIVGAMIGHYLGQGMGLYAENEPAGFLASVIGAVIVLAVYRTLTGKNRLFR